MKRKEYMENKGQGIQEEGITIPVHKSSEQLQKENNQLLAQMVSLLEGMDKDNGIKSLTIDSKSLSDSLSNRYNGGFN